MESEFRLFPEQASSLARQVDALYAYLVGVSVFFTLLICVLILFFAVRYRRGSKAHRRNPPTSYLLEASWAVIPLILTMVMFFWGAVLYFQMRRPPDEAIEISVVAKQWMWKMQHPQGRREINTLHVPLGRTVRLRMISEDVIHSFYVPAFRVKMDVLPDRYTMLWFEPIQVGEFHLFCAEYCGTGHSSMIGRVVVQQPAEYSEWVSGETGESPVVAGQRLFERHRCNTCHKDEAGGRGPSLLGLFGQTVPLQGGGTVVADDGYIRESIIDPSAKIVAGYQPLMPTYKGQLGEGEILKLIAYIKSLRGASAQPGEATE